jgi:GH24 family phage-related lysozyme (muramidase)
VTAGRTVSDAGLAFIKAHEGFRARAVKLPDGRWLIGYSAIDDEAADREITAEGAEERLRRELEPVQDALNALVFAPLTQGQFDALASLGFSIGVDALRTCGVAEALNDGRPIDAAAVFDAWSQAQVGDVLKPVDALVRRRAAEKAMFLELESGPVPASSALLRPRAEKAWASASAADAPAWEPAIIKPGPAPEVLERLAKILPERPPAPPGDEGKIADGDNRVAELADARLRQRGAAPFPPAPYPLRRGTAFPGAPARPEAGAAERAQRLRGSLFAAPRPDWAEQWPWFLMGGGLALLAVAAASLRASEQGQSLANLGWLLGVVLGALALAAGGYHAARRVAGIDE